MTVKELKKLVITVYKGSDSVENCSRKVVLTNSRGDKDYDITLTGGDALIPLEVDQLVMVDMRWESFRMNGEQYDEYYVMSIQPLDKNVKIEEVEPIWEINSRN